MKCAGLILFLTTGVILSAWIAARVDPNAYAGGRSRHEEERLDRNRSAVAMMLGEFRTSMSDIMFIKTELYLHGGVSYVPHHDEAVLTAENMAEEVDEHQSELGIHDDEDEYDHSGTPTLIPEADRDFRGIIGKLHREVKPWQDPAKPHLHADGRELLPWFRMMTASDPHYVRGYVAGGFWLQSEDPEAALRFIEEGLRNNPHAFQLYVSRGFLKIKDARRHGNLYEGELSDELRAALEDAREDFRLGVKWMLRQRPEGGKIEADGEWGNYHEGDALAACVMDVGLTRRLGDPKQAVALVRRYLEFFPDAVPLLQAVDASE